MMALFFPQTINFKTITGGFTGGRFVKNAPVPGTFEGSVQPITGLEADALQIGRVDEGTVKVYTDTELNVSQQETDKSGDLIEWEGREYEIVQKHTNQNGLINHFKYIAEYRQTT